MNLHIARWGNSLAIRIPAELTRSLGVKEGDSVVASLTADGGIAIRPTTWDRKTFAQEIEVTRNTLAMGESVMDELRRGARY
jgi:antitoxin MazE